MPVARIITTRRLSACLVFINESLRKSFALTRKGQDCGSKKFRTLFVVVVNGKDLLRESNPSYKICKSSIRVQYIEPGFEFYICHLVAAFLETLFQPRKGLILVSQPCIDQC